MSGAYDALDDFTKGTFTYDGQTKPVYRKGTGPGVVVIHEIPGITPAVAAFAREVVDAGFTVVMPSLLGEPGKPVSGGYLASSMLRVCVSSEFTTFAVGKTTPVTTWLRALARDLHEELGSVGVGAVGMCFSGGFALAMMIDEHTVAPVLSQPSLPFAAGRVRSGDLNLSPDDLDRMIERARSGCEVLGLRFTGDRAVGTRFATLQRLLADKFIAVEFPSTAPRDHSVLTEQRQQEGVDRVLEFLKAKLQTA